MSNMDRLLEGIYEFQGALLEAQNERRSRMSKMIDFGRRMKDAASSRFGKQPEPGMSRRKKAAIAGGVAAAGGIGAAAHFGGEMALRKVSRRAGDFATKGVQMGKKPSFSERMAGRVASGTRKAASFGRNKGLFRKLAKR